LLLLKQLQNWNFIIRIIA